MEGGVTVILTLMLVVGLIAGGVALFGAGGWVQRRREKGEMDGNGGGDGEQRRPEHMAVEDDSRDVQVPREPSTSAQPPE